MSPSIKRTRTSAAVLGLWLTCVAASASAQQPSEKRPTAVLFSTAAAKGGAAPLDSVLHAALEKLNVVSVVGRPGMDLSGVQLAIDCVSETPQCLRAVAAQTGAQVLIAPSLQSTPSELVISLLRFDSRDGQMKRVARRQSGSTLRSETLDAIPAMLRELFGLPEPAPKPAEAAAAAAPEETPVTEPPAPLIEPPQEPEEHGPVSAGPFILGGAGIVALGTGAVLGILSKDNQDKYNDFVLEDEDQIDELEDLKSTSKTQGTIANVMFGVGTAALIAGAIWLAVDLSSPSPSETGWDTALIPAVGPGQLGLSLVHRGGMQ